MSYPTYIAFFEQNKTDSSALAAMLLAHLTNGKIKASYTVLDQNNAVPVTNTFQHLFSHHRINIELSSMPLTVLHQQADKVDILIGLCLKGDSEILSKSLKQSDIEKDFAICSYWDLSHLNMNEPISFAENLYTELQQRIGLLLGKSY